MSKNTWLSVPFVTLGFLLISFHLAAMPERSLSANSGEENAVLKNSATEKIEDGALDSSATQHKMGDIEIEAEKSVLNEDRVQQVYQKPVTREDAEIAHKQAAEKIKELTLDPVINGAENSVLDVSIETTVSLQNGVHRSGELPCQTRNGAEEDEIGKEYNNIAGLNVGLNMGENTAQVEKEDGRIKLESTAEEGINHVKSAYSVRNEDLQPQDSSLGEENTEEIASHSKRQGKKEESQAASELQYEEDISNFVGKDPLYVDISQTAFEEKFPDQGKVDLEPEPPPLKTEPDIKKLSEQQETPEMGHGTSELGQGHRQERDTNSAVTEKAKQSAMPDLSEEQGLKENTSEGVSENGDKEVKTETKFKKSNNEQSTDTGPYVVKATPKVLDESLLHPKNTNGVDNQDKSTRSGEDQKLDEKPEVEERNHSHIENITDKGVEDGLSLVIDENITSEASKTSDITEHQSDNETDVGKEKEQNDKLYEEIKLSAEEKKIEEGEEKTKEDEQLPDHDDIPSFSEWAQKQLEEAEKKKAEQNTTTTSNGAGKQNVVPKMRSKNYASLDCGAKIIATNPESQGASNIISPHTDEYMLNACITSKIWFVVELCEAIQAKRIEIANFELFSSGPKDFVVYISDRYPTREWLSVGGFTAEDDRNIQSFNLDHHLFGKFVKVELLSHHGMEHYCPLSLFQVHGTSEYEVLETENQESHPASDDDDEESPLDDIAGGRETKNLIGSATEAVLSMVKKAAEVFRGDKGNETGRASLQNSGPDLLHLVQSGTGCDTPKHETVCEGCSENVFMEVYALLSCNYNGLLNLLDSHFIYDTLISSDICGNIGLDFRTAYYIVNHSENKTINDMKPRYITLMLGKSYVAALCNLIAAEDGMVSENVTMSVNGTETMRSSVAPEDTLEKPEVTDEIRTKSVAFSESIMTSKMVSSSVISTSHIDDLFTESKNVASKIQPTKTLKQNYVRPKDTISSKSDKSSYNISSSHSQTSAVEQNETSKAEKIETSSTNIGPSIVLKSKVSTQSLDVSVDSSHSISQVPVEQPLPEQGEQPQEQPQAQQSKKPAENVASTNIVLPPNPDMTLDSIISDMTEATMEAAETASVLPSSGSEGSKGNILSAAPGGPTLQPGQQAQKESVFVRLSSRIKALERNMSLSSQYLEELSKRYKKQMEEMQRSFNKTVIIVNGTARKATEHELQHQETLSLLQQQIKNLTTAVTTLVEERELYHAKMIERHLFLLLVEILVMSMVFLVCQRRFHHQIQFTIPQKDDGVVASKSKAVPYASLVSIKKQKKSEAGGNGQQASAILVPKRRLVEEAVNITETCHDLLPSENSKVHFASSIASNLTVPEVIPKKKKKKKKELQRVQSMSNLLDKGYDVPEDPSTTSVDGSSAGVLFSVSSLSDYNTTLDSATCYQRHHIDQSPELNGSIQEALETVSRDNKQNLVVKDIGNSWDNSSVDFSSEKQHTDVIVNNKKNSRLLKLGKFCKSEIVQQKSGNGKFYNDEVSNYRSNSLSPVNAFTGHDSSSLKQKEPSPRTKLKSDNWEWYRRESSKHVTKENIPDRAGSKSSQVLGQQRETDHGWTRKNGLYISKNGNIVRPHNHLTNAYR